MDILEEMDKFLERYNLPRLNGDKIENLNRPITSKEFESVIKNFLANKTSDSFTGEFYQTSKKELIASPSQTHPKIRRGGNSSKLVLRDQNYPDTKSRQGCPKKNKTTNEYH